MYGIPPSKITTIEDDSDRNSRVRSNLDLLKSFRESIHFPRPHYKQLRGFFQEFNEVVREDIFIQHDAESCPAPDTTEVSSLSLEKKRKMTLKSLGYTKCPLCGSDLADGLNCPSVTRKEGLSSLRHNPGLTYGTCLGYINALNIPI